MGHDGTERVSTPGRNAERGTFGKKKKREKETKKREMKEKTMGNSPSLKSQYMELVKEPLHPIGIKTSTRRLSGVSAQQHKEPF